MREYIYRDGKRREETLGPAKGVIAQGKNLQGGGVAQHPLGRVCACADDSLASQLERDIKQ